MLDITLMKKNLITDLPQWHYQKLDAVIEISGDDDGLWSGNLLSFLTGYPITDFTDFDNGRYRTMPYDRRERVSVDLSKVNGKGYDNHFTRFSKHTKVNREMINVNNQKGTLLDDYTDKYGMNTLFVIYACYKDRISLPKSESILMVLLTIDSAYKGFYTHRKSYVNNLEYMGLKDELLPVLENHSLEDFEHLSKKVREYVPQNFYLNRKTGRLEFSSDKEVQERAERFLERISEKLGFPITLPEGQFELYQSLNNADKRSIYKVGDISNDYNLYCYAITDRGHVRSSYTFGLEADFWRRV